jgi:serine phosphatase RsbU (regulator of sigma subunit)/anti-sigma regulatory factor (Ser/Thr protein kinase)
MWRRKNRSPRGHVLERDDRVATAAYAPEPSAAAEARRFVRETLRSWGVPGNSDRASAVVDDAVLLTSELVTNAVVHAGTQVLLSCRMGSGAVEVAVSDRHPARALSSELPPPVSEPAERTSGRGLMLPAALASAWGPPAPLDALAGPATHAHGSASQSVMTVPFLVEGRVTGILAVASGEPDQFSADHSVRLQRVADRMALSLERARLGELERARRGRVSFLAEASDLLAGTLDQEKIIALAAQLVVPRLAAWCGVLINDEAGAPRPAYVWHADESRLDALARLLEIVPLPALPDLGGGHSWSLALDDPAGLPAEALQLAADSAWCFPLAARGRSLGVLTIGRQRGGSLPREVAELAEDLARRTALAIDNAQLYERQQQTSRALQRSLLPPEVPHIPGLDVAVAHEVAGEGNEVGGDFYDVFAIGEGRWRFAIGDVCGTGPEAAAVTGLARHTLRILAGEGYGIAAVLDRLNRLLLDGGGGSFITLIHGEIHTAPDGVRLSLVCAGHPLPLLLKAAAAEAGAEPAPQPEPAAEPQPLLGVIQDQTFVAQDVRLDPGDLLLCVTDGITERREGGLLLDDDDGLARLLADCGGLSAGAVAARIQRAVTEFGTGPPADDMALLVLRAI